MNQLKQHDYVSTQKTLLNSNKPVVKNAFSYLLDHKQLGYGTFELYGEEGLSNIEITVNRYVYGDYLTHQTQPKDSLAYIQFKNAYASAKQTKDTLLLQECLFRICILQFYYQLPYKKKRDYVPEIKTFSNDKVDEYWYYYFSLNRRIDTLYRKEKVVTEYPFDLEKAHEKLITLAGSSAYLKGHALHNVGIYYYLFTVKTDSSINKLNKAIEVFSSKKNNFFNKNAQASLLSLAIVNSKLGKNRESIRAFHKANREYTIFDNSFEELFIYDGLYKNYKVIKIPDSALFYLGVHNKKASELNKDKLVINNIEYEEDYQSEKRELQEMKRRKLTLQKVLFMLLPTLGITFLIIVLLYFIYKQSRKEVREIKQLVIKNHIILKDKTKVYINDLMHIKAEDHYIRLTSNGKNHLVRGRLSDLDEQPPPNFILTHRSNITNRNFVMQISKTILLLLDASTIPISRKFKDLLP